MPPFTVRRTGLVHLTAGEAWGWGVCERVDGEAVLNWNDFVYLEEDTAPTCLLCLVFAERPKRWRPVH